MARQHARKCGPGNIVQKTEQHRIRLDMGKVDNFIEFANRPYFYHDVAYGTRQITLDSGFKITMPNVVRNVTKSTIIAQYLKYFKEDIRELKIDNAASSKTRCQYISSGRSFLEFDCLITI